MAIKEPWRMAVAYTGNNDVTLPVSSYKVGTILNMIEKGINCPLTSSMGRLFDAVSSLVGLRHTISHEGEAAIELEKIAEKTEDIAYNFEIALSTVPFDRDNGQGECLIIKTKPLFEDIICDLRDGILPSCIANRFHHGIANILVKVVSKLNRSTGITTVILSGGEFLNRYLIELAVPQLEKMGFRVFVPSVEFRGDGGLALGQIACAADLTFNT